MTVANDDAAAGRFTGRRFLRAPRLCLRVAVSLVTIRSRRLDGSATMLD
jgi:hypothetical protein